ncbi:MAG: hypothetical protein DRJ31_05185, partial [Candidatus Methanomethylicota archaeon]
MKVLLAIDWHPLTIGGVQSHVRNLAQKLKERGAEVAIVSKPLNNAKNKLCESLDSKFLTCIPALFPIDTPLNLPDYDELKKVIEKFSPDVIHAHHAFTPLSLMSLLIAEELGIKRVLTNHSITIGYNISNLWKKVANTFLLPYKLYISKAQVIISVSRAADNFISNFADNIPRVIIPNGVDTDFYSPSRSSLSEDSMKILFVGRLVFRKGAHVLVRAFKIVCKEVKDAKLEIVGRGYMTPLLVTLIERLGIRDKVFFYDLVNELTKKKLYDESALVALPSLYGESFCITALEAMSMQKPVVASRCGGLEEIITDDYDGLLVEPNNHVQLAEKIV